MYIYDLPELWNYHARGGAGSLGMPGQHFIPRRRKAREALGHVSGHGRPGTRLRRKKTRLRARDELSAVPEASFCSAEGPGACTTMCGAPDDAEAPGGARAEPDPEDPEAGRKFGLVVS